MQKNVENEDKTQTTETMSAILNMSMMELKMY